MSEINVTPLVDVMLVLLIIFMVAAPLMTVGVPIELPQTQAKQLNTEQKPITVSVTNEGAIFLGDNPVTLDDLVTHRAPRAGRPGRACAMRPSRARRGARCRPRRDGA